MNQILLRLPKSSVLSILEEFQKLNLSDTFEEGLFISEKEIHIQVDNEDEEEAGYFLSDVEDEVDQEQHENRASGSD
ncbi:unnamed protein product [Didymodactylos carnosus]|uniref:Uncharacterized protein n=1 Tax=Didymodactylos carnosus TaxID=1234261 RepID=A0A815XTD4_9BILA|nr:unnamed protein product [Didymodactylos carnosus]CAF4423049.1 unnamed protein product [Didymodactylos carnosus]